MAKFSTAKSGHNGWNSMWYSDYASKKIQQKIGSFITIYEIASLKTSRNSKKCEKLTIGIVLQGFNELCTYNHA